MSTATRWLTTVLRDVANGLRSGLDSPDAWIVALLAACFVLGFATRT
jgi:hypothetical protein